MSKTHRQELLKQKITGGFLLPNVWTTQIVGFNGLIVGEAIPILVSLCFGHLDPVPLSTAA